MVVTVDGLEAGVKALLADPAPHYVLFSSNLDANSGLPWCPDCVRALPAVISAVNQVGDPAVRKTALGMIVLCMVLSTF